MTSSQPTVDVTQQDKDVRSGGLTDRILSVLQQLVTAVSQLQTDVAELKTTCASARKNRTGMLRNPRGSLCESGWETAQSVDKLPLSNALGNWLQSLSFWYDMF